MKHCTANRTYQILYSIVHLKWKTEVEKINLPSEATLLMAISELGIFPRIVHSQNIAKAQWALWKKRFSTLHCHCIFPWVIHFNTSQRHKIGSGVECSVLWTGFFSELKCSNVQAVQKVVAMLSTSCPQAVALLLFRSSSCLSTVKELFTTSSPKSQSISDVQTLVNNDGTWVQWKSIRQLYWRLKSWYLSSIVHLKKRNRK